MSSGAKVTGESGKRFRYGVRLPTGRAKQPIAGTAEVGGQRRKGNNQAVPRVNDACTTSVVQCDNEPLQPGAFPGHPRLRGAKTPIGRNGLDVAARGGSASRGESPPTSGPPDPGPANRLVTIRQARPDPRNRVRERTRCPPASAGIHDAECQATSRMQQRARCAKAGTSNGEEDA